MAEGGNDKADIREKRAEGGHDEADMMEEGVDGGHDDAQDPQNWTSSMRRKG